MAEIIQVPGVFTPGVGDHIGYAQDIKDINLNGHNQSYLNELFNQGKGIDGRGNIIQVGKSYSAGNGLSLVGTVFSLDAASMAKLNSVAVGVKAENHRGNWIKQKPNYEPLLSVYANSGCTQRPVVGQGYERLYVKLKASEVVGNQTWKHTSNCDAGIRFWEDPIDGTMFEVTLYVDFTNQWDNYLDRDAVLIMEAPSAVVFTSDMCTNFYTNGAYNNTGGTITNTNYDPYKNTESTFVTVYYNNAKWLCNGNVNEIVDEVPSDSSTKWIKLQSAVENKGIRNIVTEYALSTSASRITGAWSQSIKTMSNTNKYLWERTTFSYTDGTTYIVPAHVVGVYGDPGANGTSITIKGTIGPDDSLPSTGNNVGDCYVVEGYLWVWTAAGTWVNSGRLKGDDATQYYIHTAHADSNVYQDETHWTVDVPQRDYAYIGICVNTDPNDPTGPEGFAMYEWTLSSTITYVIVPNKNILTEGDTGTNLKIARTIGSSIKYLTSGAELTAEGITIQPSGSIDCQLSYSAATGYSLNVSSGVKYGNDYTVKAMKGGVEIARTTVGVVKKGDRGYTSAKLRGPSVWKAGITYMGGSDGEEFQDLVIDAENSKMYLCKFTHTAVAGALPKDHVASSNWNSTVPWQESVIQDLVATHILYSERIKGEILDIVKARVNELTVGNLNTMSTNGATINIQNGMITVSKTGAIQPNIEFGIDGDYAVLKYYDNDGRLLYNLGPDTIMGQISVQWARYMERTVYKQWSSLDNTIGNILQDTAVTVYMWYQGIKKFGAMDRYSTLQYENNMMSEDAKWRETPYGNSGKFVSQQAANGEEPKSIISNGFYTMNSLPPYQLSQILPYPLHEIVSGVQQRSFIIYNCYNNGRYIISTADGSPYPINNTLRQYLIDTGQLSE